MRCARCGSEVGEGVAVCPECLEDPQSRPDPEAIAAEIVKLHTPRSARPGYYLLPLSYAVAWWNLPIAAVLALAAVYFLRRSERRWLLPLSVATVILLILAYAFLLIARAYLH